jgi:hypothetical protein
MAERPLDYNRSMRRAAGLGPGLKGLRGYLMAILRRSLQASALPANRASSMARSRTASFKHHRHLS